MECNELVGLIGSLSISQTHIDYVGSPSQHIVFLFCFLYVYVSTFILIYFKWQLCLMYMSHYCNFMFCLFYFFRLLLRCLLLFSRCSGQFGSFAISRHPTTIINRHTGITLSLPFSFSLSLSLSHTHTHTRTETHWPLRPDLCPLHLFI